MGLCKWGVKNVYSRVRCGGARCGTERTVQPFVCVMFGVDGRRGHAPQLWFANGLKRRGTERTAVQAGGHDTARVFANDGLKRATICKGGERR